MSLILAFDTSTPSGSVALADGAGGLLEREIGSSVRHAESLLPAIAALLQAAGRVPGDLTSIVVGAGPGSFTGVRIAAATARGLVRALRIPLHTYGSLLAEARATGPQPGPVCALFDARRGEVYAACYQFADRGWEIVLEPQAMALEDVIARIGGCAPVWTGEGARALDGPPAERVMSRAAALIELARARPEAGLRERPADWEPEYLRPPGAERIRR